MKKNLLLAALFLCGGFASQAAYNSIKFTTNQGVEHFIALPDLEIEFNAEKLIAINSANTLELPLADVKSMEFSDSTNTLLEETWNDNESVSVWTLSGTKYCDANSMNEALTKMEKGIYVVKYSDGSTLKVAIK